MNSTNASKERPNITKIAIWLTKLSEQDRRSPIADLVRRYESETGRACTKDAVYGAWRDADLPEGPRRNVMPQNEDRIYHLAKAVLEIADALEIRLSGRDTIFRYQDKGGRHREGKQ